MSRELALECDYLREAACARKFQYVPTIAFSPFSVCVCERQERLLNFRDGGELTAVPCHAAQGKGVWLWPELSPRITTLSQLGMASVS